MPLWRSLATATVGVTAFALAAEVGLRFVKFEHRSERERFVVWNRERDPELRAGEGLYQLDPDELWVLRPGAVIPGTDGERINRFGMRGPELDPHRTRGVVRIAAIGGGGVFGIGVRWEDTWCAQLVDELARRGIRAEILCAGVPEHTVRSGLHRWRSHVAPFHPDLLISAFSGVRECMPASGSLTDSQKIAALRAMEDHGNVVPGPRQHVRVLHLASWLRDLASGAYWNERADQFEEALRPAQYGLLDWPHVRRVPTEDFEHCFSEIADDLRLQGGHLLLLNLPRPPWSAGGRAAEVYAQALRAWAQRHEVPMLDGSNAYLAALRDDTITRDELFRDENYPSECGHFVIARALADEIQSWITATQAGNRR